MGTLQQDGVDRERELDDGWTRNPENCLAPSVTVSSRSCCGYVRGYCVDVGWNNVLKAVRIKQC